jgi:hypothetical protein
MGAVLSEYGAGGACALVIAFDRWLGGSSSAPAGPPKGLKRCRTRCAAGVAAIKGRDHAEAEAAMRARIELSLSHVMRAI